MPLKVAAAISILGLILAVASVVYGHSSPTASAPEKAAERIKTAVARHGHIVDVERAETEGDEEVTAAAREKLAEAKRKNDALIAERDRAIARHDLITGILRYSGCLCMLAGALSFLAKTQSK